MIAVIADDFTGAAEVGGIGLRYGLKVVISTQVVSDDADVLVIVADTRVQKPDGAAVKIKDITKELLLLQPEFIYKKLDSVLRGNVGAELEAQMQISGSQRALIVAGNPYFKRFIVDGTYYVNGVPLNETDFAHDKDFNISSSSVLELVASKSTQVLSLNPGKTLPQEGLIVGNVSDASDMQIWSEYLTQETIAAGGAGFFEALLKKHYKQQSHYSFEEYRPQNPALFVFGSAYPKSEKLLSHISQSGLVISEMPSEVYQKNPAEGVVEKWANEVIHHLKQKRNVIISSSSAISSEENFSLYVRKVVGQLVQLVTDNVTLNDLLIEGGATASMIFKNMNITRAYPFAELDNGVIQMRAEGYNGLTITTKPGSYNWPLTMLTNL